MIMEAGGNRNAFNILKSVWKTCEQGIVYFLSDHKADPLKRCTLTQI